MKTKIIAIIALILIVMPFVHAGSKIVREESPTLVVQLEPIREINITVKKRSLADRDNIEDVHTGYYDYFQALANMASDLTDKESAIIFLERIKEDPWEDDFQTFVVFDPNDPDSGKNVRFLPGYYKIDGQMLTRDQIIIPEDTRKFCKSPLATDYDMTESERLEKAGQDAVTYLSMGASMGPVGLVFGGLLTAASITGQCLGEEEKIELEQIVYANDSTPGLIGGVYSSEFYVPDSLIDRGFMTMYVFAYAPPQFHEEIGFISGYSNLSIDNANQIGPS